MRTLTRTFQTRLPGAQPQLDAFGAVYGQCLRTTYALARRRNVGFGKLKAEMMARFGIPGRVFNAIHIQLAAMVSSRREAAKAEIDLVDDRIAAARKLVARLSRRLDPAASEAPRNPERDRLAIHFQNQKIDRLEARRVRLKALIEQPFPKLCFGGRTLFGQQDRLAVSGFPDHAAWRTRWRERRSENIQFVGSADEPMGNKTCRASVAPDGSITLRVGLPETHGGPLTLAVGRFAHGHAEVLSAIQGAGTEHRTSETWQKQTAAMVAVAETDDVWHPAFEAWFTDWQARRPNAEKAATGDALKALKLTALRRWRMVERARKDRAGHAVSWRFVRDDVGWRVLVTIQQPVAETTADVSRGVVGIDLNADHVAMAVTGAGGDLREVARLDTHLAHKTSGERSTILRETAAVIVKKALALGLPIALEELVFARRKRRLEDVPVGQRRMLSSLAYRAFFAAVASAAARAGVAVVRVDPAWTSVIGALTFARPHGISVHLAAAHAIARRAMGRVETVPTTAVRVPASQATVRVSVPVSVQGSRRDSGAGVTWRDWQTALKAALAARRQSRPSGSVRRMMRQGNLAFDRVCRTG